MDRLHHAAVKGPGATQQFRRPAPNNCFNGVNGGPHQRKRRGPSNAPAKVQIAMVPLYQSATKGSESSTQCSEYAAALMLPATRPARAPVRTRSVGAVCRIAHTIAANGNIAMMGMDSRHSSHCSPVIMFSQYERGAAARLIAANSTIIRNGNATNATGVVRSPPGRASFVRAIEVRTRSSHREEKLQQQIGRAASLRQVATDAKNQEHGSECRHRPDQDSEADVPHDLSAVDPLDVRAEHGNQIIGLHVFDFSAAIAAANALSPRCTFTFTADTDISQRTAASVTLNPSSFTYWIARRIFCGKRFRSL